MAGSAYKICNVPSRQDVCMHRAALVFTVMEDVMELSTIEEAEGVFGYLESRIQKMRQVCPLLASKSSSSQATDRDLANWSFRYCTLPTAGSSLPAEDLFRRVEWHTSKVWQMPLHAVFHGERSPELWLLRRCTTSAGAQHRAPSCRCCASATSCSGDYRARAAASFVGASSCFSRACCRCWTARGSMCRASSTPATPRLLKMCQRFACPLSAA